MPSDWSVFAQPAKSDLTFPLCQRDLLRMPSPGSARVITATTCRITRTARACGHTRLASSVTGVWILAAGAAAQRRKIADLIQAAIFDHPGREEQVVLLARRLELAQRAVRVIAHEQRQV